MGENATELDATLASEDRVVAAPHPIGTKLGRYTLAGVLGSGGMGVVYRAFDPQLGRAVALKVVRPDASSGESRTRLVREAQAIAKLSHPNVIAVHDVGSFGDEVFVAMELVDGESLASWIEARRSRSEILDAFAQAGRGLAAAHAAGLVHRDFKPLNVLVGRDGRVRVLDFGLARPIGEIAPVTGDTDPNAATQEPQLTRTGAILGTPLYMAPEQHAGGTIDARTDQFAFCVALFHALYGTYPFRGDSVPELMIAVMGEKPLVPPGVRVPGWLRRIALRGLAVQADARFASMDALLDELAAGQRRGRRRIAALGIAVVLAIGATGIAVALRRHADDLPPFTNAALVRVTYSGEVGITALSPDGTRLAYQRGREVVVDDLAHGTARVVARVRNMFLLRWSPDGAKLLAGGLGGVDVLDSDGGDLQHLTGCPIGTLSPDSREVMHACAPFDEPWQITTLATGALRLVKPTIHGQRWLAELDWSSRNGLVLALATGDAGRSLWVLKPDGSDAHELVHANGDAIWGARWNIAGDRITYSRSGDQTELRILAFDPDGMTAHEIGARSMPPTQSVSVSADEQMLLVSSGTSNTELVVLDGEHRTRLSHDTETHSACAIAPDGHSIAYPSEAGGTTRIHIVGIDGRQIATLAPTADEIGDLAWSPDGRELVYIARHDGLAELRRVTIATGEIARVPADDVSESVAWAPGKDILYQVAGNQNFAVVDPITNTRHLLIPDQHTGWLFTATPSPDGKHVLAFWNRRGNGGVWMIGIGGALEGPLYVGNGGPLGWSSDGRTAFVGDGSSVIAIDVATREPRIERAIADDISLLMTVRDRWIALVATATSDLWVASRDGRPITLARSVQPYVERPVVVQPRPVNIALTDGVEGWRAAAGLRVASVDGAVSITTQGYGRLSQRIDASAYRGKRVRFRARLQLDHDAMILIRSLAGSDEVAFGNSFVPRSADWQVVETLADVHPNADAVEIELGITGSAKIADATFEIVPR